MENTGKERKLFREKSIEQLSAPEQLTGYLHVTGPGVWFVLGGLIILLVGLLVWGIFGRLISSVTVPAKVEEGKAYCYVLKDDLNPADGDVAITIGDVEMTANTAGAETVILDTSYPPELFSTGYLHAGRNVTILVCDTTLKEGFYDALIVTDELKPISLLFSNN